MSVAEQYELVVGMEVHAQLNSQSKLFCGCALSFGEPPNTRTCPVCLGLPGVLPHLNREAFSKCLRIAVALGMQVPEVTDFDRKSYTYPDLPKNYQITQLYHPLGTGGELELMRSGKRIRFDNVHLEEDAGKLSHQGDGTSRVDFNRAGTPLAEIVTAPDFRSVEDVDDYMLTLTQLLKTLDVCHARMQEGNLRFEASVSVRKAGSQELGERTEIKNLNSYTAVCAAVTYEHLRQSALLAAGQTPRQETRLWDEAWEPSPADYEADVPAAVRAPYAAVAAGLPEGWRGRTRFMRSKEDAQDYRYMPEPDLPRIEVPAATVDAVRAALPELPGPRCARYREGGLSAREAEDLVVDAGLGDYVDALAAAGVPLGDAANYTRNLIGAVLNKQGLGSDAIPVPAAHLVELHELIASKALPKELVLKQVWPKVVSEGLAPKAVVAKHGIQAVDEAAVRAATDAAWEANPQAVADLRGGKQKARGAILGAVMRATKGQASPQAVNARIDELLK